MSIGDSVFHHMYGTGVIEYISSDNDNPVITINVPNRSLISLTLNNFLAVGWGVVIR